MKKISLILLCLFLCAGTAALSGCGNNLSDLQERIEQLEGNSADVDELLKKIEVLEDTLKTLNEKINSTVSGNDALKSQIDTLTDTVSALSKAYNDAVSGNAALKQQIDDLKSEFDATGIPELQQQIESLQSLYNHSVSGNQALKTQIDDLTSSLRTLQATLNSVNETILSLQTKIDTLSEELVIANGRIALLEGKVDGDPNRVYGLGDTVTYSNNGIKLFSITVTEAWLTPGNAPVINFTYHNYAIPMGFTLDDIFQVVMPLERVYVAPTTELDQSEHKIPIGGSFTTTTGMNFHEPYKPIYNKIYFGIAKADNVSAGDKQHLSHPFVPFAVFELDFQPKD